jgi:hypothetical protein
VSKAWRETYARALGAQIAKLTFDYRHLTTALIITSQTTLFSAVLASPSRIALAHEYGLYFANAKLQRIAGRVAGISALPVAHELASGA